MSFPTSPANNQTALVNGINYVYNSTESSWTRITVSSPNVGPVSFNSNTITSAVTFVSGQNGISVGPISITGAGSVNIPPGQRWVII